MTSYFWTGMIILGITMAQRYVANRTDLFCTCTTKIKNRNKPKYGTVNYLFLIYVIVRKLI